MSKFKNYIYEIVQKIPYGKVVSYGQVALYAGVPRGARQVGWILRQSEGKVDLPWWRVVNNLGKVTIKGNKYNDANIQRKLLLNEGIEVDEEFNLDIGAHRYKPDEQFFKNLKHDEKYLDFVAKNIPFGKPLAR